jgi:hypothetical protein
MVEATKEAAFSTASFPVHMGFVYGTNELGTGMSVESPNCRIRVPAVLRSMNQFVVDGRKTDVSNRPSPS